MLHALSRWYNASLLLFGEITLSGKEQTRRQTGVLHIHFNGAGGDIGAGKWNDRSKENRQALADRLAAGMKLAWENTKKSPLSTEQVG